MNLISSYIFVHNQNVIVDYLKSDKFSELPNLRYVFVGSGEIDKIENLSNVIIARNLPINIEEYPKWTSYTGWYALWKNGILDSQYSIMFEYDMNIKKDVAEFVTKLSKTKMDFIGFFPMSLQEPCYIKDRIWSDLMIQKIKEIHNVDIDDMLSKLSSNTLWSATSNTTWRTEYLIEYLKWFEPVFESMKDFQYAGHAHERSLSFFYFTTKGKVFITKDYVEHFQLNSHGTSPLEPNRFEKFYEQLK